MIRPIRQLVFLIPLLAAALAGPARAALASWTPLGPDGGTVTALAIDPANARILYAVLAGKTGIYKSVDAGATWMWRDAGLPAVHALAIDPRRTVVLYAGTATGVFKSKDGGASWTLSRRGLNGAARQVQVLATDATSAGLVYASTDGGVFKTIDGGDHWQPAGGKLPADPMILALAVTPGQPKVLYTAFLDGPGLYKSVNGGATWALSQRGIPDRGMFTALAIDPRHAATVYAATYGGVYKSTNGGASWSLANTGLGVAVVFALAIDPQNPRTLFAGTFANSGAFRSDDAGASWSPINDGLGTPRIFALAVDPQGTVYAGTDGDAQLGGVFQSVDGQTWRRAAKGFHGFGISVVAAEATAAGMPPRLWAGTPLGLYRSLNGGGNWRRLTNLEISIAVPSIVVDPDHPGTVFVMSYVHELSGAYRSHVYKTTDEGRSWGDLGIPQLFDGPFLGLRRDPVTGTLWVYGFGLARSDDGGATWTLDASFPAGTILADVAFDPSSPRVLYAGGSLRDPLGGTEPRLFRSADGGGSWSRIDGADTPLSARLLVSPASSLVVYATNSSGVFRSADAGAHWVQVFTVEDDGVNDLVATPDGTLYAATDVHGVYTSRDGLTWTAIDRGLESLFVTDLYLDPRHPRTLYAATGGGVATCTVPN